MTITERSAPARSGLLPHGPGFWIIAAAFLTAMAFSTVPTPIYAIYQQRDGFPTIVVTVIFAVYAVGVMLSLYLAGHVSDWLGRRRVILAALALNLLAAILFLAWDGLAGLLVARFVNGLGIGIITATATAHLSELGAETGRSGVRSQIVSTFANLGGLSLGALIAGVLVTTAPAPTTTPYVVFALLLAVEIVLVALVPETVEHREERPAYSPQRVAVPAASRGAYLAAAAGAFAAFAVFGTFTGLSSTFLVGLLGEHSHLLAGAAPFIVFMAASLAQIATVRMPIRAQMILAIVAAVAGLALISAGAVAASLALFLLGGGAAGAGVGILFRSALGTAGSLAAPEKRGEALAGIFLIGYAGMTFPPLLTAGALTVWPIVPVLVGLSAAVAVLVVVAGSRLLRG
ncbi:MFS transporter [Microbacterium indicum]|uniref:MFS transporter n=1 Tax=Microbacterium indicum TaxID=358100 RepID=UPI0004240982|nr:MFS transporter [Microbacterium indicum]